MASQTKKQRVEAIRAKLETCDPWILRGLAAIYERQTYDEKVQERTKEHNGIGFTGLDGEIMTSFANQMIARGFVKERAKAYSLRDFFSPKQEAIIRRRMPKYAGQLDRIATGEI